MIDISFLLDWEMHCCKMFACWKCEGHQSKRMKKEWFVLSLTFFWKICQCILQDSLIHDLQWF